MPTSGQNSATLRLEGVWVHYDRIPALRGISLEVHPGEMIAILGANGAGKSTTLRSIFRLVPVSEGEIVFQGESLRPYSPEQIARLGMAYVPEGRRIFWGLTVRENLEVGGYLLRLSRGAIERGVEEAFSLFPVLRERHNQTGGTLSGGEQQMLAIARALMSQPKLLLMDEPSLGLAPIIVEELFHKIVEINRAGTTIVLVEQNAKIALSVCTRGYVLETGEVVVQGTRESLFNNEAVRRAYLGAA